MKNYSEVSSYYNNGTGAYTQNTMGWTATLKRADAFPVETYSIFPSLAEAKAYAAGTGAYTGLPYEGQIIAVTDGGIQKVYVLDSSTADGLRQLAAGDDTGSLQQLLNAEIQNRQNADNALSDEIENLSVSISGDVDSLSVRLSSDIDRLVSSLSSSAAVTIEQPSATEGMLKTYEIKQGGASVGKIDIPKDFVVKDATVKTVSTAGSPYAGAVVGEKYIDLEINAKTETTGSTHLYLPIKDMVDAYSGSTSNTVKVEITDDNKISAYVIAGSISTDYLADGAVTTAKIANSAVTTDKINDLAVTSGKLATDSVTNEKIADNAVSTNELSASAVTTAKIADSAVTAAKINDGAVTTTKIADDAVTNAKIADNAVDTDQINAGAVTTAKIADSNVTTAKINNGAVTTDKIDDDAVTNAKIADNAVDTAQLNSNAVTAAKIASEAVTEGKIHDSAVTNGKLAASSVTLDKLSSDVTDYIQDAASTAVNDLDYDVVTATAGNFISAVSQTNGKISVETGPLKVTSSQMTDFNTAVDGRIDTAIGELNYSKVTATPGNFISAISQTDGKIEVETGKIEISSSQMTDFDSAVDGRIDTKINAAVDELNYAKVTATAGNFISAVSQTDGLISVEIGKLDITSSQMIDFDSAVNGKIDTKINTLNITDITNTAGKTVSTVTETDGIVNVTFQDIAINVSQVTDLTASLDAKLDRQEFSQLSNAIGLSAASASNPVVTKQDIADLAGAMHFIGPVTLSSDSETIAAAVARLYPGHVVADGDVIIIPATSKEYVYANNTWTELGDEDLYAKKTELQDETAARQSNDTYLSGAIDKKIYIDGVQTQTLSAIHINEDEWRQKVAAGTILSNELYIVSSDYINAYDQPVQHVGEPVSATDAATKNYVDTAVNGITTDIQSVEADIDYLSANSITSISLNGLAFTVNGQTATLNVDVISCGTASA